MPSSPLDVLQDEALLIRLLADITSRPDEEVAFRLSRERAEPGICVRQAMDARGVPPHRWSDGLAAFYAETDAFLYESLVWNQSGTKAQMREWTCRFLRRDAPGRVLAFGDGAGIDALTLALGGHEVTSFDVSASCRRLGEAIFARSGVVVRVIDDLAAIPLDHFDAVVCLDVLEHDPAPAATVSRLAAALRPGGCLIVHAPFFFIHRSVSTHLLANRRYSGDLSLYRTAGLDPIDGELFWNPLVLRKRAGDLLVAVPWRLRLGGLLLALARWWAWPHVCVTRLLLRRNARPLVT